MQDILFDVFLFLHFVGLALLLGGLFVQIRVSDKRVNSYVLYGAYTQLITGIVLLLLTMKDANHIKVTVKLAILLVIIIVATVKRKTSLTSIPFFSLIGMGLLNVGLAVFW